MSGNANPRELKHALLTPINHILGFTEIQLEEADENGLLDCVPAFAEINARGRALLSIDGGRTRWEVRCESGTA